MLHQPLMVPTPAGRLLKLLPGRIRPLRIRPLARKAGNSWCRIRQPTHAYGPESLAMRRARGCHGGVQPRRAAGVSGDGGGAVAVQTDADAAAMRVAERGVAHGPCVLTLLEAAAGHYTVAGQVPPARAGTGGTMGWRAGALDKAGLAGQAAPCRGCGCGRAVLAAALWPGRAVLLFARSGHDPARA
jgi:hypothetical protein